ncbi:MAG: hypothetical protein H6502_03425 [Candidatus Woesearchaeota archaeon]|nr:MAG: hypothetical protein H6502_03425 [Candidatus Woesearchaeota archaeon]
MEDYAALGFKAGIEIHQQLDGEKLFCSCPSLIRKDDPQFVVRRKLRLSSSEEGGVDNAAAYEKQKNKDFVYQGYEGTTCLVELDEEPPHPINAEALLAVTTVAKLLHCTLVDQVQFMRKMVIDGSNVSGFQRTALIGYNGYFELHGKRIAIETICLEEEASQAVSRSEKQDIYNLSRQGIALIEIATGPDFSSADEVRDGAAYLGMVLRSTPTCKRGIGSIRQDVNISIKGHPRVEIKGFQDIKSMKKIIDYEVDRQRKEKKGTSHVRKATAELTTEYLRPMPGADRMYPETDVPILSLPHVEQLPVLLTEKIAMFEKTYGLSKDFAEMAVDLETKETIDVGRLFKKYARVDPKTILSLYVVLPKEISRKLQQEVSVTSYAQELLDLLQANKLATSSLAQIIEAKAKGEDVDFSAFRPVSEADVKKIIAQVVAKNKGAPFGALMGLCMKELGGKVDGKLLSSLLKKEVA